MLHITNGDSVIRAWNRTDLPGIFLAWRDVLHEGPVPANLSFERLTDVRARFVESAGWSSYQEAIDELDQRNRTLSCYLDHEEIVLWFEHDLNDQLQLLQLLDWFSRRELRRTRLSMITLHYFPGVEVFNGLGQLDAPQLQSLFPKRTPITPEQLKLGQQAWEAFRAPDPTAIERLCAADLSALPYLKAALRRHLEQFPSVRNGLSRTEQQIIEVLREEPADIITLFRNAEALEQAPFLGDWGFFRYLQDLGAGAEPLVQDWYGNPLERLHRVNYDILRERRLRLTPAGMDAYLHRRDRIGKNGFDRWLGGVHLSAADGIPWRWDTIQRRLARS